MLESLINKVARLKACNFLKNGLQHKCFPEYAVYMLDLVKDCYNCFLPSLIGKHLNLPHLILILYPTVFNVFHGSRFLRYRVFRVRIQGLGPGFSIYTHLSMYIYSSQHICFFHKTIFFSLYTQKKIGRNKNIFFTKFFVLFKINASK